MAGVAVFLLFDGAARIVVRQTGGGGEIERSGGHHVELLGRLAVHRGGKEVVGQRILLSIQPEAGDGPGGVVTGKTGDGVVVILHGKVAFRVGKLIHQAIVPTGDVGGPIVFGVANLQGIHQSWRNRVPIGVHLRIAGQGDV